MIKLKIISCVMFLFVMCIPGFSYESPFNPPFISSSRPYILKNTPASLFFSKVTIGLALESMAGNYNFLHLFPWPAIEGYGRLGYKKFGGSIAVIDRYQFTTRDEMRFTTPAGEYLGTGYFWNYYLVYTLRTGLAYEILPNFVLGFSGDINYGLKRYDLKVPAGTEDQFPGLVTHEQDTDYSGSFSIDAVITSKKDYPILEVLYESETKLNLDSINYFIPTQISVFLNIPIENVKIGLDYYYRFGNYRDYYETLKSIASHDFACNISISAGEGIELLFTGYTVPMRYDISSKAFGFGAGPRFTRGIFLREVLLIYENGKEAESSVELKRYGVRFRFAF